MPHRLGERLLPWAAVLCLMGCGAGALAAEPAPPLAPPVVALEAPPALPADVLAQAPATLAELEGWAEVQAPAVRLAQAEADVAAQRTGAARAGQGARVFGGASLGGVRESVTDTTSRDYQRGQAQVGVRWPLLGSREAQQRGVREAEGAESLGRLRQAQAQRNVRLAVRQAYVRFAHSLQRRLLAQEFLSVRAPVEAQLLHRRQAGVMLEADRLDLSALFDGVQAAHDAQRAAQSSALRTLARLAGQPVARVDTAIPGWPARCMDREALLAQAGDDPAIAQARTERDTAAAQLENAQHTGLEAGVSLSQSVSRDIGGQPGRSTVVGVDFSMPLEWRAQRDAARGQLQSERDRADQLMELRLGEYRSVLDQALADWQLRGGEMPGFLNRLQAAQEGLRVARLRLDAFDGDGYSRLLMARYALYQASLQVVDGSERRALAALDVLALGSPCPPQPGAAEPLPDLLAPALTALSALPPAARGEPAPPARAPGLGWFSWSGQALLDRPARLDAMPQDSQRVLLSFTSAQLRALARPPGRAALRRLLEHAHDRGMAVELVLGEPSWVLPAGREALLALLAPLRHLPFDGLNLDLERSQLDAADQPGWEDGTVATLRAVRAATPWPLALTTHYRELQVPGLAQRLQAAGATEVVAMVYVSRPERAAELARPLVRQAVPGLRVAVAQSMEDSLTREESSHGVGRAAALQRWRALAQSLSDLPAFAGVVVQAWEDFEGAAP